MPCTSQVADHVAGIVKTIEQRVETLPRRIDDAKRRLAQWGARTRRRVGEHPVKAIAGAFAIGFVLARLARHA